ncbi:MAG: helix-turn-helix transcriptional regulator [Clostridia bacterium]|nr:helix-turn-helix transcriptional regulator [Clostridia bacterium]
MKLKLLRLKKGISQKELAEQIGTDVPMLSKFETYKCLPIPSMLRKIMDALKCTIDDLYEPHELYQPKVKEKPTTKKEPNTYHLSVHLPREARAFLKTALKDCGYSSVTEWINRCFEQLQSTYKEVKEKEKTSPNAVKQVVKPNQSKR